MRRPTRAFALAAIAMTLSACGAVNATVGSDKGDAAGRTATPLVVSAARDSLSRPSPATRMVCSAEIHHDVATLLGLPGTPRSSTTWANHVYRCTYHLAQGPLVVSVSEARDVSTARRYFAELRSRLANTHLIHGADALGLPAFEAAAGSVTFLKDASTLQVDATQLPDHVGENSRGRTDLAYTLATDILGCWSGN